MAASVNMTAPADETDNIPVSLPRRAPIGPISERSWNIFLAIPGLASLDYENSLVQANACIRSQMAHSSFTKVKRVRYHNQNVEATTARETMKFPYPAAFQKLLKTQPQTEVVETLEITETVNVSGIGSVSANVRRQNRTILNEGNSRGNSENNVPSREDPLVLEAYNPTVVHIQTKRGIGLRLGIFSWTFFNVRRTSAIEYETPIQPVYIVLGIFHRGYDNPQERIAFVLKPKKLFWELRWAVFRLRGLSSTLLSLRQVKSFRLYRVRTFL
jgi:hypothetical protein